MVVVSPAAAQVKVGVLTDMDSICADISGKGAVASAQMAAEDFGPVLGGPVEIVSANHQNSPDVASGIARRWYDAEGVDMITDGGSSAVALAVELSAEAEARSFFWAGEHRYHWPELFTLCSSLGLRHLRTFTCRR
jgi:branched-chain amino acid transport system substrate-binding protein